MTDLGILFAIVLAFYMEIRWLNRDWLRRDWWRRPWVW